MTSRHGPRWIGSLAMLSLLGAPRVARADAAAVAEALFRAGTALLAEGHVAQACAKLADSQKTDPALGTLFYLAACHEKQGLTASAWSEFASAIDWATRTNQPERVLFGKKHLTQLEANLSTVRIRAKPLPGLELRVDDGLLSAAVIGTPLPLDPGSHVIEVTAPEHEAWRTTVTVSANASAQSVDVPPLAASTPVAAPARERALQDGARPSGSGSSWLTWTAAGVAAVGLGVGSVFGGLTFAERDSAHAACPSNRCAAGGLDDIDRARAYATVSTAAFGVGVAAAIGAGYLLLRGNPSASVPASAAASPPPLSILPSLSLREVGVAVTTRFE